MSSRIPNARARRSEARGSPRRSGSASRPGRAVPRLVTVTVAVSRPALSSISSAICSSPGSTSTGSVPGLDGVVDRHELLPVGEHRLDLERADELRDPGLDVVGREQRLAEAHQLGDGLAVARARRSRPRSERAPPGSSASGRALCAFVRAQQRGREAAGRSPSGSDARHSPSSSSNEMSWAPSHCTSRPSASKCSRPSRTAGGSDCRRAALPRWRSTSARTGTGSPSRTRRRGRGGRLRPAGWSSRSRPADRARCRSPSAPRPRTRSNAPG